MNTVLLGVIVYVIVCIFVIWLARTIADILVILAFLGGLLLVGLVGSELPRSNSGGIFILAVITGITIPLVTMPLWPLSSILRNNAGRDEQSELRNAIFSLTKQSNLESQSISDLSSRLMELEQQLNLSRQSEVEPPANVNLGFSEHSSYKDRERSKISTDNAERSTSIKNAKPTVSQYGVTGFLCPECGEFNSTGRRVCFKCETRFLDDFLPSDSSLSSSSRI